MTESMRLVMGGVLQGEDQTLLTNCTRTPLWVRCWTRARRSFRLRVSRSMLCTTTVSRHWRSPAALPACAPPVSRPDALSVKTWSRATPSSRRFSFWSKVLTHTYPIRRPPTAASKPTLSAGVVGLSQKNVKTPESTMSGWGVLQLASVYSFFARGLRCPGPSLRGSAAW